MIILIIIIYIIGIIITGNLLTFDVKEKLGPLRDGLSIFGLSISWIVSLPIIIILNINNIRKKR